MKKILIIDDESSIRELIADEFQGLGGYSVLLAWDGEKAIEAARSYKPDLIILDIQLPKLDGYQVCRLIKADKLTYATKVLMMSGMTHYTDRQKALEAGADDFIPKPFVTRVLLERAQELLSTDRGKQ